MRMVSDSRLFVSRSDLSLYMCRSSGYQSTGSTFLGYSAYGHPEFDTARSPLGDLVYRLKNRGDGSAIEPIVETVVEILKTWRLRVDAIVPVLPSNTARKNQPVIELATLISERTGIPFAPPACQT